jgi:hypothetical protein
MANAAITGTATVGAACAPNGLVAQDGTGLLLSCQSGVWSTGAKWHNVNVALPNGPLVYPRAYLPAGAAIAQVTVYCVTSGQVANITSSAGVWVTQCGDSSVAGTTVSISSVTVDATSWIQASMYNGATAAITGWE